VLKAGGVKVIHKMTSIRHALSAQKIGVDAITILGYGSGGHVGMDDVSSFILLPMAVKELDVPVIAGGGVSTGSGFLGALAMGAEAVLLGTAFFASKEADVHDAIKQKLVETKEMETTLLLRSVNNSLRVAKNKLADQCLEKEAEGATLEEVISIVAGGKGKAAYFSGDAESGPVP
ncbi:MAG: nitronate monooxygenase, partial [bacterium]|nr:nitronate monooxygenase [bacterium]